MIFQSRPDAIRQSELENLFDLFLNNREALRDYFRRLTMRHPEWRGQTDDVLDEALLCVVRALEREHEARASGEVRDGRILDGRFEAYFRQIVRNLMIDIWRTLERHRTTSVSNSSDPGVEEIHQISAENQSPSEMLERREEIDRLQQEVLGLPQGDREVILLWMLGVPYEEMARIRRTTRGAVCSQKKRALLRLRDRLSEPSGANETSQ